MFSWFGPVVFLRLHETISAISLSFSEVVVRRCFSKYVFLIILQISHEKTCVGVSFCWKETSTQVFSCEICQILRTPVSTEHHRWLLLSFSSSWSFHISSKKKIRILEIPINPLSANPTKWLNKLKQFVGCY